MPCSGVTSLGSGSSVTKVNRKRCKIKFPKSTSGIWPCLFFPFYSRCHNFNKRCITDYKSPFYSEETPNSYCEAHYQCSSVSQFSFSTRELASATENLSKYSKNAKKKKKEREPCRYVDRDSIRPYAHRNAEITDSWLKDIEIKT